MWPFLSCLQSWQWDQPWRKTRQGCVQARRLLGTQRTFLPARTVWGKAQLLFCWALVEAPGWPVQQGLQDTEAHPCLVILHTGLGSLDPQLSLFFLERLASPRSWFLWQQNRSELQSWALCCWGSRLSAEQLAHTEHGPHSQSGSEPPASFSQAPITIDMSAQCSHTWEWKALSHCGGLNKLVQNIRELRENCQSWNEGEGS